MAVEAHSLLLLAGGHKQFTSAGWPWTTGDEARCATARLSHQQAFQLQQASCVGGVGLPLAAPVSSAAAAPMIVQQYAAGGRLFVGDAAESGVTFGGGGAVQQEAPRKRKRAEQGQTPPPVLGTGAADVAAQFQQQLVDVDRLVLQHVSLPLMSPAVPANASAPAGGCLVRRLVINDSTCAVTDGEVWRVLRRL